MAVLSSRTLSRTHEKPFMCYYSLFEATVRIVLVRLVQINVRPVGHAY